MDLDSSGQEFTFTDWAENDPKTDCLSDYFDVPFFVSCHFREWYNCVAKILMVFMLSMKLKSNKLNLYKINCQINFKQRILFIISLV